MQWLCKGPQVYIVELQSSSRDASIQVSSDHYMFFKQHLHGCVMVVVLQKQDVDVPPVLLFSKTQSFAAQRCQS